MRSMLAYLIAEATSIICAATAGVMAVRGVRGWGWFLGVAALTTVTEFRPGKRRKEGGGPDGTER